MRENKTVSNVVIRRLPRYYRYLTDLLADGKTRISSKELSRKMHVTASQIRQDFNCFGGFGQQGYGYNVEYLRDSIAEILGIKNGRTMIIIGVGNLGRAVSGYSAFEKRGFKTTGLFDINETIVGKEINGLTVMHESCIDAFVRENKTDIAVLAIPHTGAQEMADKLVSAGIKGIWNFSHAELNVPQSVALENVHLSDSLMTLSCKTERLK